MLSTELSRFKTETSFVGARESSRLSGELFVG